MTEATVLLRQVHPTFIQQGRVTSQAFRPTPKDEKLLSVYDGDLIVPQAAWVHYTTTLNYASDGVLAITVTECVRESLPARADPQPFPEHAVVDFSTCTDGQIEKKSKRLKVLAEQRGWQFQSQHGA